MKAVEISYETLDRGISAISRLDTGEYMSAHTEMVCGEKVYVTEVYQNNGWTRKQVYWKDGTVETLFSSSD